MVLISSHHQNVLGYMILPVSCRLYGADEVQIKERRKRIAEKGVVLQGEICVCHGARAGCWQGPWTSVELYSPALGWRLEMLRPQLPYMAGRSECNWKEKC
jgi:hypothetical protein